MLWVTFLKDTLLSMGVPLSPLAECNVGGIKVAIVDLPSFQKSWFLDYHAEPSSDLQVFEFFFL